MRCSRKLESKRYSNPSPASANGTGTGMVNRTSILWVKLRPLSKEIVMQADEIQECLWMPVDEFIASDSIANFNKQIVRAALESDGIVQSFHRRFWWAESREYFMPRHLIDGLSVVPFPVDPPTDPLRKNWGDRHQSMVIKGH